jgi:hypothetical protein
VRRECRRSEVPSRERVLRLRVRNGDDRPLELRGVAVRVPVERAVFEAAPGGRYRLVYGSNAAAPRFDLARSVGDARAWAASAVPVPLGAARRLAAPPAAALPWTERHPALLWGGLVAVVVVLGLLTARALRQPGS